MEKMPHSRDESLAGKENGDERGKKRTLERLHAQLSEAAEGAFEYNDHKLELDPVLPDALVSLLEAVGFPGEEVLGALLRREQTSLFMDAAREYLKTVGGESGGGHFKFEEWEARNHDTNSYMSGFRSVTLFGLDGHGFTASGSDGYYKLELYITGNGYGGREIVKAIDHVLGGLPEYYRPRSSGWVSEEREERKEP